MTVFPNYQFSQIISLPKLSVFPATAPSHPGGGQLPNLGTTALIKFNEAICGPYMVGRDLMGSQGYIWPSMAASKVLLVGGPKFLIAGSYEKARLTQRV